MENDYFNLDNDIYLHEKDDIVRRIKVIEKTIEKENKNKYPENKPKRILLKVKTNGN